MHAQHSIFSLMMRGRKNVKRILRRSIVSAVGCLTAINLAVVFSPAAYAANDGLPLPNYGDVAVDDAHQHVFVSGGPTTNGVVVTDFSGRVKKTINGQSGAAGLALSADATKLYVALAAGDAISVIDTGTLAETARFSVGPQTCPTHLARTGTLVWFGYGCESDFNGKIGKLDTAAAPPVVSLDQQGDDAIFQRAPLLAASGAAAGPLVAGQLSLSLSTVRVYTVAGGALAPGATGDVVGSSLADVSVTSDGATVSSASGSRDHVESFATADLSRRGAYPTGAHPSSVAVAPGDTFLAVAHTTSGRDDVLVYATGGTVPVKAVDLPATDLVATRGLAWSADRKRLFVITQRANDPTPTLVVVTNPTGNPR
jgi:YVTN family beta-propeller protein